MSVNDVASTGLSTTERAELAALLARALRRDGLGRVCRAEARDSQDIGLRMSYVLIGGLFLGVVFSLSDWTNAGTGGTLAIAGGVLAATGLISLWIGPSSTAVLIAVLWTACLIVQIQAPDHDVGATLGTPFLLTSVGVVTIRLRRLTTLLRGASLLLPVALTVLLIPLFTQDLWSAVSELTAWNIAAFTLVAALPLAVTVGRQVHQQVPSVVQQAVEALDSTLGAAAVEERLVRFFEDADKPAARERLADPIRYAFDLGDPQRAGDQLASPLRRQTRLTFVETILGLIVAAAGYLWLLAWILLPTVTVSRWSDETVEVRHIDLALISFDVPLSPYLKVAALLGAVATTIMLASAAIERDYARQLAEALLRHSALDGLLLVLPYQVVASGESPTPLVAHEVGTEIVSDG
jgi:hypothetical protein